MAAFDEAHFIPLDSQTNIYGLTKLTDDTETTKVLVGSSKGKVTCVEYVNEWDDPVAREVPFTYIPSGEAEIVSIDAFSRHTLCTSNGKTGLVIGISFVLCGKNSKQKQFVSIYSSVEEDQANSLDSIAEGCQHIELDFVPFQLYHTRIFSQQGQVSETVFLLSGSDCKIHMYREVMDDGHSCFVEQTIEEVFPEFKILPSNVLWMDIRQENDNRVSAVGCQDGNVQLSVVENISNKPSIKNSWTIQHDGPITVVRLFSKKSYQYQADENQEVISQSNSLHDYHLLVCCAVEPCTLYLNALVDGLENPLILPDSDNFDCVLCACVADVDWDGDNEILLGTFGQELLAYKMSTAESGSVDITKAWQRQFNSPIFAIDYVDMTKDGLCEIVVACLSGIHVLQHHLDEAANAYTTRVLGRAKTEEQAKQHEEDTSQNAVKN